MSNSVESISTYRPDMVVTRCILEWIKIIWDKRY